MSEIVDTKDELGATSGRPGDMDVTVHPSKGGHPKGLWVLFGTEMWERFNFYGMRAILTLFMVNSLLMKESDASLIYGGFLGLCYLTPMLGGLVDYTPSSVPALRHWGIMIFGIGVLMVVAAFRPWLRFETMVFSAVEKSFMVYLVLTDLGQPWAKGYLLPFVVDSTIVAYSMLYFISDHGRPQRWTATGRADSL